MSNDKTAEEIERERIEQIENEATEYTSQFLPYVNTTGHWLGYIEGVTIERNRSAQQLKEYREKLKEAMEKKWAEYYITDPGATEAFPEVIKLIDQTDSTK